jgi:hypothetical protein
MKNWFRYFARAITRPQAAANSMLGEKDALGLGLLYTVGFSFLYSITSLLLYWRGNLPQGVLLPIPPERWYLYQAFYTIPVGFAAIALLAVITHGLARRLGGIGRWQDSWMLLSLASTLPWFFFTWLPETIFALVGRSFPWSETIEIIRQIIPALWQLLLGIIVLQTTQQITWWKSLACILAGTVPFVFLFALFIR